MEEKKVFIPRPPKELLKKDESKVETKVEGIQENVVQTSNSNEEVALTSETSNSQTVKESSNQEEAKTPAEEIKASDEENPSTKTIMDNSNQYDLVKKSFAGLAWTGLIFSCALAILFLIMILKS